MKRIKEYAVAILLTVCIAAVMIYPRHAAEGIERGIELCMSSIVPSIFPMMLLCVLAVECGYAGKLGKLCAPVSQRLFGLPGEAGAAVLMSMIGGYPAGAKTVTGLYERGEITIDQARKMALFCFCAGPAFLIGVVGEIAGNMLYGWILMAVQSVTVLVLGVLICRRNKCVQDCRAQLSDKQKERSSLAGAVVSAVGKSAEAVMQVCLYVVVFSAANQLLCEFGLAGAIEKILVSVGIKAQIAEVVLPVLMEVTGGCVSAVGAGLPMLAFAVGFGGLSVQMQVLVLTEKLGVDKGLFFAVRLIHGAVSALLASCAIELLPDNMVVAASVDIGNAQLSGSPQGAVMLLVMCVMFMLCLPKDKVIRSNVYSDDLFENRNATQSIALHGVERWCCGTVIQNPEKSGRHPEF